MTFKNYIIQEIVEGKKILAYLRTISRGFYKNNLGPNIRTFFKVYIPLKELIKYLQVYGVINKKKRPCSFNPILGKQDKVIIAWYNRIAQSLLYYYFCADNLHCIKVVINYYLRWSLFYTLSKKYKSSVSQIICNYDDSLGKQHDLFISYFPVKSMVISMKKSFFFNSKIP
jgi:hypothetical protein